MAQERKELYRRTITLTLPIVIQNILSSMVSSADVVMLNYVGQSAISAVSLATQYTTIIYMLYYGLGTGATLLCAQYFGKGDIKAIRCVEGIALRFSMAGSVLFSIAAFFFPRYMMLIYTNDEELIGLGITYLRFMGITYLCWSMIEIYLSVLRSIGQVTTSMILNVIAFSLNIVLNAVFIFGLLGAPKMGVAGVALATMLSRLVELAGCILVSLTRSDVRLDLRYMFIRNKLLLSDFIRLAIPAMINDMSWGLAFSMYSVIMGHLGSDVVAANSLVTVARNFSSVFAFGIANGGAILLGNVIGEKDMEKARTAASCMMRLTVAAGAVGGVLLLAACPFVLHFASLSEVSMGYLRVMFLINSYYIMGQAVNTSLIAGVFRAGGDTKFGMICDSIDMWCYAVPAAAIAAFVFKAPVLVVYFIMCTDEFAKWPVVIAHYRGGKWLKNITRDGLFEE